MTPTVETPPSAPAPPEPEARPALPHRRLPWAELGIEAFAVFLSVLVALAVTAWLDARHERALRQTALDQFAQELAINHAHVRDALPYHERVYDAFEHLVETGLSDVDILNMEESIPDWESPRQVRFAESARRAAEVTGASALLDFETAGRLSDVHTTQDELLGVQRAIIQAGLSPQMFEDANASASVRVLALYFDVVVEYEQTLDSLYVAALDRVEAVGGRADRAWGARAE